LSVHQDFETNMKTLATLFTFLLTIVAVHSQGIQLTGFVKDVNNVPVEYANAVLINAGDSSIVKGALTDSDGKFSFENIGPGNYLVYAEQLGFTKTFTPAVTLNSTSTEFPVPDIILSTASVSLDEINVSALRPFIEHKVDRTIVNVENSIVNAGSTALDILMRSPGITVDNDGNIHLRGKQGVLVTIDDKPSYLSQKNLYDMLRNMTADELSQIEIITNPSAKYDAAGTSGIINLKLRKKQNFGMNGSLRVSYGQGVYPDAGTGINLNYRNARYNAFGSYDYFKGFFFEKILLTRRFTENTFNSEFDQRTYDKGNFTNHNFKAGIDYFAGKKSTIGVLLRGNLSGTDDRSVVTTDISNLSDTPDSSYTTVNTNDSKWNNLSANLNYLIRFDSLGSKLSVDADYGHFDNGHNFRFETRHYNFLNANSFYDEVATNKQPAKIDIRSGKTDFTKILKGESKIEAGLKSSYVTTDNDVQYFNYFNGEAVSDTTKTNHFNYKENINAAYINFSGVIKKLNVQAGLRAEQTISEGKQATGNVNFERNYIELFPSIFLSYPFSSKHEGRLSYSRRIDRPAYQQLNPFRYFIDPYNFMEGNPNLQPQLTNSFEASYVFNKLYSISINYSQTSDVMTQITKQNDSTRTTFITTENLNSSNNYGITISIPIDFTKFWQSSSNINVFNNHFKGLSSGGIVDNELTSYTMNTNNSFKLLRKWTAEINAHYNSPLIWGTWLTEPSWSVSAGLGKSFFNEKLNLKININDIFHTEKIHSKIRYQNIDAEFTRIYDSQFVRLHVTYHFGKTSVAKSRQRRTGAEEEQNRIQGR
jgi:iron complex outermembrane recepter protein